MAHENPENPPLRAIYLRFSSPKLFTGSSIVNWFPFPLSILMPVVTSLGPLARNDINWWCQFASCYSIHFLSPSTRNSSHYTDASGSKGLGALVGFRPACQSLSWLSSTDNSLADAASRFAYSSLIPPTLGGFVIWLFRTSVNRFPFPLSVLMAVVASLGPLARNDINWWRQFASCYGIDFLSPSTRNSSHYTDASGPKGLGALVGFRPACRSLSWLSSTDNSLADAASRFAYSSLIPSTLGGSAICLFRTSVNWFPFPLSILMPVIASLGPLARNGINWWRQFASCYSIHFLSPSTRNSSHYTDASGSKGLGALIGFRPACHSLSWLSSTDNSLADAASRFAYSSLILPTLEGSAVCLFQTSGSTRLPFHGLSLPHVQSRLESFRQTNINYSPTQPSRLNHGFRCGSGRSYAGAHKGLYFSELCSVFNLTY